MKTQEFRLNYVYSSHMVLQRDREIRFAGIAPAGSTVKLSFAGAFRNAVSSGTGTWETSFPAMSAGGPYELLAECEGETRKLEDILIGDVWICSGQSNMSMPVCSADPFWRAENAEEEVQNASHPRIRLFNGNTTKRIAPRTPLEDESPENPGWLVCSPETVGSFSACGYFFGRQLEKDLQIPIGLVNISWGGTIIESWISRKKFQEKNFSPMVVEAEDQQAAWQLFTQSEEFGKLLQWEREFEQTCALPDTDWQRMDFDDSSWEKGSFQPQILPVPGRWLCRISFDLPDSCAGNDLILSLGVFNDTDKTFLNGEFIGSTGFETPGYWGVPREYKLPGKTVHAGRNVISVIVDNHMGNGQINLNIFRLKGRDGKEILLQPEIRILQHKLLPSGYPVRPEVPSIGLSTGIGTANYPSTLYNGMMHCWTQVPIRGMIWYHGCSNNGMLSYYLLHKMFLDDVRENWHDPDLPVILVQLAAFANHTPSIRMRDDVVAALPVPIFSNYGVTREIQAEMPHVRPMTGLISAIDRGDHSDIHPRDKQTLGYRLAVKAESMLGIGPKRPCDSPEYAGMRMENGKIRVFFRNADSGLVTSDGKAPAGFYLGDRAGLLYPADVQIDGNSVLLSFPGVDAQFVRYAFTNYTKVNLCSKDGNLPVLPFRTDKPDYEGMFPD